MCTVYAGQQFNVLHLTPAVSEVGPEAAEAVATWGKGASTIIYMAQELALEDS